MGRTKKDRKKSIRYAALGFVIVFFLSGALLLLHEWEKRQGQFPVLNTEEGTLKYKGVDYELKKNVETFLVIGLDKFEGDRIGDSYNNDQQADFLMLFVLDNNSQQCTAIQISRDTMASMNILGVAGQKIDTVTKQIALAHTYGNGKEVSCRNTADSVSGLFLGMKVNHYMSLTMDSVPVFNDLIGGVEVTVLDDFTGIDNTLIKGEKVTLLGQHALKYVRARKGLEDSSNSARMKRQQQYLEALYEKTHQRIEADEAFIVEASLKMADYIVSDRSITQLQELIRKFSAYEFSGIKDIEGKLKKGKEFMEFYPDEEAIQEMVVDLFYKRKAD